MFTYFVSTIAYTAGAPTAFATIGWKYYLVFVCITMTCFAVLWFTLPETTGKSLEEIGALFGDEVVLHFSSDGRGLVEINADEAFEHKGDSKADHVEVQSDEPAKTTTTTTTTT